MGNEDNEVTWLSSALAASRGLQHHLAWLHMELEQVLLTSGMALTMRGVTLLEALLYSMLFPTILI